MDDEELTSSQAAEYVGMTRQALTVAAERGEIGRKVSVLGRKPPYLWLFRKAELDAWMGRAKNKGGRPKDGSPMRTPLIAA